MRHTGTVNNACDKNNTCDILVGLQVADCGLDLSGEEFRKYHRRNRVCDKHLKVLSVMVKGQLSRYCQQVRVKGEIGRYCKQVSTRE